MMLGPPLDLTAVHSGIGKEKPSELRKVEDYAQHTIKHVKLAPSVGETRASESTIGSSAPIAWQPDFCAKANANPPNAPQNPALPRV